MVAWHLGHWTGLPIRSSQAENDLPQCVHWIRNDILNLTLNCFSQAHSENPEPIAPCRLSVNR